MSENFIQLGETRIKKSNIKNFGVSNEKLPEKSRDGIELAIGITVAIIKGVYNKVKHGTFSSPHATPPKKTHRQYLYVTTYQNDNFKFYEDQIDIRAAVRRLEAL